MAKVCNASQYNMSCTFMGECVPQVDSLWQCGSLNEIPVCVCGYGRTKKGADGSAEDLATPSSVCTYRALQVG